MIKGLSVNPRFLHRGPRSLNWSVPVLVSAWTGQSPVRAWLESGLVRAWLESGLVRAQSEPGLISRSLLRDIIKSTSPFVHCHGPCYVPARKRCRGPCQTRRGKNRRCVDCGADVSVCGRTNGVK